MDFELDEDQRSVLDAVGQLLERHAGPARAIELAAKGGYDAELEAALEEAGFLGLFAESGALEAALLTEAVARAAGVAAIGAATLVIPGVREAGGLGGREASGPVALAWRPEAGSGRPVRFAAHARQVLFASEEAMRIATIRPGSVEPVRSSFGYPFGMVSSEIHAESEGLAGESGALLRWWRVALACEVAGSARGALDATLEHVKQRRQFGRALGSFQGLQHRLAHLAVRVEGTRWLALEAADATGARAAEAAAVAAAYASETAKAVFDETHQFCGAMGFTREHDLHVFSMRLQALRLELGGAAGHRRSAARARWPVSA